MLKRTLEPVLVKYSNNYPLVSMNGPRQSGKTTLAKMVFPSLPYVSLENLDTRIHAQSDPRGFLSKYKDGAIFDEIQNTPDIFNYLQEIVDSSQNTGRYVLTGSQNFVLNSKLTQSLAGRVGMTTLLPLSLQELDSKEDIQESIFKGGYPRLFNTQMHPLDFYPSYVQTYIERDVRQLRSIDNLGRFQSFLKLCAGRVGSILNISSLAQDCGISPTTARSWLEILEASYIIFLIHPYHQNFSKRLIKMPKIYFYDTGLLCSLLGLETPKQIESHYLKGNLFENLCVLEVLKSRLNQGLSPNLYFWRDVSGHEVDLIGEWGGKIHAIEIKWSSTFNPDHLKNLKAFKKLASAKSELPIEQTLIYNGENQGLIGDVDVLNAWSFHSLGAR